uniref:Uncharacterized protein n=1 Tax=Arundo donax TaxID=35708 RepID=A0A0A9B3C0_ARUDO
MHACTRPLSCWWRPPKNALILGLTEGK